MELNKIVCGDCVEVLKTFPENSLDSCVTDPPYGLEFMGKEWDKLNNHKSPKANGKYPKNRNVQGMRYSESDGMQMQEWHYKWAKEVYRVLKPGGYLLSFGGTRTYHRMACAIEDAGFEIRDTIAWVYGSGFPKSLNIGKQIDKLQGNKREVVGKDRGHTGDRVKNHEGLHDDDNYEWKGDFDLTRGTSEWEGWGTALKPAFEPIVVARKPISEKTIVKNVLKWGIGGINIDGCRVKTNPKVDDMLRRVERKPRETQIWEEGSGFKNEKNSLTGVPSNGRWPANFIHDGSDEVVGLFPNIGKGNGGKSYSYAGREYDNKDTSMFNGDKPQAPSNFNDSGSASRFFYCAKASKSERNMGLDEIIEKQRDETRKEGNPGGDNPRNRGVKLVKNSHPTVKPVALMRYLCKLVTPLGGIVLDPFIGSGTTGIAGKMEGFNYIGIEKEEEYIKIAKARINVVPDRLL